MMEERVLTVVFRFPQGEAFPKELSQAFRDNEPYRGATISAMSFEDEITRNEELESKLGGWFDEQEE